MTDFETTHRNLDALQLRRKTMIRVAALALVPLMIFTTGGARSGSWYREGLEGIGLFLIGAGILGRAWSTLYIGGRKARELVTVGPYSVCRNPLYLFAFIAVAGLGVQTGSLVMAGVFTVGAYCIFVPVVRHEERALRAVFGARFDTYLADVPRFLPRFSLWRDVRSLQVDPRRYRQTVLDGLVLFCLVPMIYGVEWLRTLAPDIPILHLP
jgi:protein-S-isoprenylcysteine O-methyltransferase Ste14